MVFGYQFFRRKSRREWAGFSVFDRFGERDRSQSLHALAKETIEALFCVARNGEKEVFYFSCL